MMEEAGEEQPEMVTHEEAALAEKEATGHVTPGLGTILLQMDIYVVLFRVNNIQIGVGYTGQKNRFR